MTGAEGGNVLSELYLWLVVIILLVGVLAGQLIIMCKFMTSEVVK